MPLESTVLLVHDPTLLLAIPSAVWFSASNGDAELPKHPASTNSSSMFLQSIDGKP